jgi:hypothetical protein
VQRAWGTSWYRQAMAKSAVDVCSAMTGNREQALEDEGKSSHAAKVGEGEAV